MIYYQSKEDRCQIFLILDYKRSRISLLFFISLHNSKSIEQSSTQNFQWQIQSRKTFINRCSSNLVLSLIKAAALPVTYYMLGYFSTYNGPHTLVKNGSTSVIYQNSMQKSMDQIKVLLLSDSETQNAKKNNDCLETEITEIDKKIQWLLHLILLDI